MFVHADLGFGMALHAEFPLTDFFFQILQRKNSNTGGGGEKKSCETFISSFGMGEMVFKNEILFTQTVSYRYSSIRQLASLNSPNVFYPQHIFIDMFMV